jgi:hypothetical protein
MAPNHMLVRHGCMLCSALLACLDYSESTHSIDPASATVDGNLPVEGDKTVYFLLCASIPVLYVSHIPLHLTKHLAVRRTGRRDREEQDDREELT